MATDAEDKRTQARFEPPLRAIKARQMGELARDDSHWEVLLETAKDASLGAVRGRIHFVSGSIHRLSGWIFLESSEKQVEVRFGGFSAQELWNLLNSLGGN